MKLLNRSIALCLTFSLCLNLASTAYGCGPSEVQPIFVFKESPDLPFEEFTGGKIGIVQPTLGRKTLVIAYRYLTGGSYTSEEQKELIEALHGKPPEESGREELKAWIAARAEFLTEGEKLPEIYVERQNSGYDFFPNCTKNAFEVATATLKDRVTSYGRDDKNVRVWLLGQDTVFENCGSGARMPQGLGAESPLWLRKDRDYQTAAALFYSLKFDEARASFERIAADSDSPWQKTADYLVARTLVRQASLTSDVARRGETYKQAEIHLQMLVGRNDKLSDASRKLLALIKYRVHPEERVRELSSILAQGSHDNLRQDLIDYVWLLNKLEARILEEEAKRKEALQTPQHSEADNRSAADKARDMYAAVRNGEEINIRLYTKRLDDGNLDWSSAVSKIFAWNVTEAEIIQTFELELSRKLTDNEIVQLKEAHTSALSYSEWLRGPNRKWETLQDDDEFYTDDKLTLNLVPASMRSDDLSDWIMTVRIDDPKTYEHALNRWRETRSQPWLVAALTKADKSSPQVELLMREAEKVRADSTGFPSITYQLARLQISLGQRVEARKVLDEILQWPSASLPLSARNQLLEQRMQLSKDVTEFLRFAGRKPVAFYNEGTFGRMSDLLEREKSFWNPDYYSKSREEHEQATEEAYKDLLPWDDRMGFDERTVDVFNWHFPLTYLAEAATNPALPDYLQRQMALAVWTRAVVLRNDQVAQKLAPQVSRLAPEMSLVFASYLNARTSRERELAALHVLLRFPKLSPLMVSGVPVFANAEDSGYYFESAWWCPPSNVDYDWKGNEILKVVPTFSFLTANQLETARRERAALIALGDAKSYLGKRVIEWAKSSPADERVPEALFIAAKANSQYKYGCSGWEFDKTTKQEAEGILHRRYPRNPWTAKLNASKE